MFRVKTTYVNKPIGNANWASESISRYSQTLGYTNLDKLLAECVKDVLAEYVSCKYPCKHAISCQYRACTSIGSVLAHNGMFMGTEKNSSDSGTSTTFGMSTLRGIVFDKVLLTSSKSNMATILVLFWRYFCT